MTNTSFGPSIFSYTASGERLKVEQLLTAEPDLAQARDQNGRTALHHAAWGGYAEIIELLLAAGAEIDVRDRLGRSPLIHMMAWCTRIDVAQQLMGHGANLDACDDGGNSAPYLAATCIRRDGHCWGDHASMVRFLMESGAVLDLHSTAILGRTKEAEALLAERQEILDQRDRVEALDRMGWNVVDYATALHRAADSGQNEMCALLMAHGANASFEDARGRPPIFSRPTTQAHERRRPRPKS